MKNPFLLYDFFCGSNTIGEAWSVLKFIIKRPKEIVDGKYIEQFEQKIAQKMNFRYAVSFASGRQALYCILKGIGVENKKVLLQAFTCVTVPDAIRYAEAKPIYIDTAKDGTSIDCFALQDKIKTENKIGAIIYQHTFGNPNFPLEKETIPVVSDCAHSIIEFSENKPFAAFISMDHTKYINTGGGGVALTDDEDLYEKLISFQNKAYELSFLEAAHLGLTFVIEVIITYPSFYRLTRQLRRILSRTKIFKFHRDENQKEKPKKYPAKLTNLQAYIGLSQLAKLLDMGIHRIRLGENWYLLRKPVFLNSSFKWDKRFVKGVWFNKPVFGCKNYSLAGYTWGSCPNAEEVCKKIANIPLHSRVRKEHYESFDRLL